MGGMHMIKKTLMSLLIIALIFPCISLLTACGGGAENAYLLNLTITGDGQLNNTFSPSMLDYTVTVPYQPVETVTITANAIKTHTTEFASDNVYSVQVNKGNRTDYIIITVRANGGRTSVTYTITVEMDPPNSNANISQLNVQGRTLVPAFNPNLTEYTIAVSYQPIESVTVYAQPTLATPTAKTDKTSYSATVSSASRTAVIEIKITAQSGAEKTYKITVTMESTSQIAGLTSLAISYGNLNQPFHTEITDYEVKVDYVETGNRTVTAYPEKVAGSTYASDNIYTATVSHNSRIAVITIRVIAQNGVTNRTYRITVSMMPDTNAYLSSLSLRVEGGSTAGGLSPVFSPTRLNYTYTVAHQTTGGAYVIASAEAPATAKPLSEVIGNVFQVYVTPGSPNQTIIITVEAQSGTRLTYNIYVNMQADDSNALLTGINMSHGVTLSPAFSPRISTYTASVPYWGATGSLNIEATPLQPAGVTILTTSVTTVNISNENPKGTITINTRSANGSYQTYTINVMLEPNNQNAYLTNITVNNGSLAPQFNRNTHEYSLIVSSADSAPMEIAATPTAASGATIKTSGQGASILRIDISAGETKNIIIVVIASNGTTEATYTISVTRVG